MGHSTVEVYQTPLYALLALHVSRVRDYDRGDDGGGNEKSC